MRGSGGFISQAPLVGHARVSLSWNFQPDAATSNEEALSPITLALDKNTTLSSLDAIAQRLSSHKIFSGSFNSQVLEDLQSTLNFKMPSLLCHACRKIPSEFFAEPSDHIDVPKGLAIMLQSFNGMSQAASAGCPLCTVLLTHADVSFLPPNVPERPMVLLTRGTSDTHQGLALRIGMDDICHSTFSRVPSPWSKRTVPLPNFVPT